ncbi:MAG TPA: extracellular solute-binding protein [Trueperaceae bacterium]|nr:extracellular solute-binding protein [Trueperaceae bacterium]
MKRTVLQRVAAATLVAAVGLGGFVLAAAPVKVSVWSWRAQDAPLWQNVQKALNASGSNVQIDFRSIVPTNYDSVLQTAFDNGNGPDLFYGRAGEGTFRYAAANFISPVDSFLSFDNFVPASLAAVHWQGKNWGVPLDDEVMAVFYNKATFAKYDLTPPQTWSQFMELNKTLKSKGVTPIYVMPIQTWMIALDIESVGATELGNSGAQAIVSKQANYDSPAYKHVLSLFTSLIPYFESNYMAVGSDVNAQEVAFATGQAAMTIDGGFDVPTMVKFGLPRSSIGVFLVPPDQAGKKAQAEWYPDADLAMNAGIKDASVKQAAQAIMKYATSTAFGQSFADIAGEISPVKGVQITAKYSVAQQLYKWFQQVPINPLVGIRSPMDTPPPTPVTQKSVNSDVGIFTAEGNVSQALLSKKVTPDQAAAQIQKAVSWYFQ